jgi:hypothetical protein
MNARNSIAAVLVAVRFVGNPYLGITSRLPVIQGSFVSRRASPNELNIYTMGSGTPALG